MVNFEKGIPVSLRQDYNENVLQTFRLAKANQIKIYMTLFDAHQFNLFQYKWENLRKLRSIVAGKNQDAFLRNILIPLLSALKAENLIDVIDKVDLMNEMDAFINRFGFWNKWQGSKNMLCKWNSVIDEVEKFPVSYSVRLHPLTPLPLSFFKEKGPMECGDFIDVHSYHNNPKLFRCRELRKTVKPVILGEFGQAYFNKEYNDQLQLENTQGYIEKAEICGIHEMYAWRLSDIRPGYNEEARCSFEAFCNPRPAYYLIQEFNIRSN